MQERSREENQNKKKTPMETPAGTRPILEFEMLLLYSVVISKVNVTENDILQLT